LQLYLHQMRQLELVIKSEKKNSKNPVIIAPNTLVATNVMPSRTTDDKIVPKIPAKNVMRFVQQLFLSGEKVADVKSVIPKYPIAIPNNTHKNAGVIVTSAVKRKIAASIPITMLMVTAIPVQPI